MMDERVCREIEDLLALRPEDWGPKEHRRVEAHLKDCAVCRALAATNAEQERLLRALPPLRLTPAGRQRLRARIERERSPRAVRARLTTALGTAAGMAVLAALAFALYALFSQDNLPSAQVEVTRVVSQPVTPEYPQLVETPVTPTLDGTAPLFAGEIAFLGGVVERDGGESVSFRTASSEADGSRLLGWYLAPSSVDLKLEWQKAGASPTRWSIFLHLMDEAGQLVTQTDQGTIECGVPDSPQETCDRLFSQHQLTLPAGLAPGLYTLYVGLYDPVTSERATLTAPTNVIGFNNRMTLGQMEVLAKQELTISAATPAGVDLTDPDRRSVRHDVRFGVEGVTLDRITLYEARGGPVLALDFTSDADSGDPGQVLLGLLLRRRGSGVPVQAGSGRLGSLLDGGLLHESFTLWVTLLPLDASAADADLEVYLTDEPGISFDPYGWKPFIDENTGEPVDLASFFTLEVAKELSEPAEAQRDTAWLRDLLEAYQPGRTDDLAAQLAAWLSAGNDPAALEALLRSLQPPQGVAPEVTVVDMNGDGLVDVAIETQWTGLPAVVCLGQAGGGFAGYALPQAFPGGYLPVMRSDILVQELTGDDRPETLISYILPGGSGSTELLYIYQWDDAYRPQLIFNAALITWAGGSDWALAPDPAITGAQQIILTYPHLYGDGFDHKMLTHPLARQNWRWDEAAGRFALAEEVIRRPEMSWGPQPQETKEDWLRYAVNEGEQAYRAGDYAAALESYTQVIAMAAADDWVPADDQSDWSGYARFRRAATLALLGRSAEAVDEMRAVAEDYAGDVLGELAAAFLSGYEGAPEGGSPSDAAARAVAATQAVDLYSHLYDDRGGALRFPIQAGGVLYPGAGLAAYLDAHPELVSNPSELLVGLQSIGFEATDVNLAVAEIQVTLRLPEAPNAEGAPVVWRLAIDGGRWHVVPQEPAGVQPGSLAEPGWPELGGLPEPRYDPQWLPVPPEGPEEETTLETPPPPPMPTPTPLPKMSDEGGPDQKTVP